MQENELHETLEQARRAGLRLDTGRAELAFETRMAAVVRGTVQPPGAAVRFQMWLRGLMGLATVTGIAAALFLLSRRAAELEDTLTVLWTGHGAVFDSTLFD